MNINSKHTLLLFSLGILFGSLFIAISNATAQENSIVLVYADKAAGYGVAYGGPANSTDRIVTALHLVAGKKTITVKWQGKTSTARVEKILVPSDLALLKLNTPLGITPITLYSGEPPWDTNINFWEIPINSSTPAPKVTILEDRTSLAKISPQLENAPGGLINALCTDAGQTYPTMSTAVINFKEANIRKAHSGSPLTYNGKIVGMVDGGARLAGGKPCVWAIPAGDFNKLYSQGVAPAPGMSTCSAAGTDSKYMFSGIRSDNPLLTAEEVIQAQLTDNPLDGSANNGSKLELYHNYTMSFRDVYEGLNENEQCFFEDVFKPGESITMDDLLNMTVNFYVEEKTGVSLMVPAECKFSTTTDGVGSLNTVTSPKGLVTMSFYIAPGDSMKEGAMSMIGYKTYYQNIDEKTMEPVVENIYEFTEEDKYFSDRIEKIHNYSRKGGTKSVFSAEMTINDGDFLAVSLNAPDYREVSKYPEEKLYFYLMQTCKLLSDFTIY